MLQIIRFVNNVVNTFTSRVRMMASLLYLKHSCNLSDEELVVRWSENVLWQFFSGMAYYEHRLPCDATQIGRFRRDLGEESRRRRQIDHSCDQIYVGSKNAACARALLDFQIHDSRILLATVQIAFDDSALRILAGV